MISRTGHASGGRFRAGISSLFAVYSEDPAVLLPLLAAAPWFFCLAASAILGEAMGSPVRGDRRRHTYSPPWSFMVVLRDHMWEHTFWWPLRLHLVVSSHLVVPDVIPPVLGQPEKTVEGFPETAASMEAGLLLGNALLLSSSSPFSAAPSARSATLPNRCLNGNRGSRIQATLSPVMEVCWTDLTAF